MVNCDLENISSSANSSTKALMKRLLRDYIGDYRSTICLAVVCMVVAAAATAANAWIIQPALDEIFVAKRKDMLLLIPLAVIGIAIVGAVAGYGQTVLMRKVGQGIVARMQVDLFDHLLHSDLALFHDQSSGRLISRFTNDIQMMRNAVSSVLTGLAKEMLTMLFLIGVMFYQSWQLSLIGFLVFPVAIYPIIRLGKRMRKVADGTQQQLGEFAAQLDEAFSAVRVVKAYSREDFEVERARKTIKRLFDLHMKASRIQAIASPMMELLGSLAIAGVIAYGGMQVIEGETTAGAFFSFIAAMMMAYKPVRGVAGMNAQLQEGMAAARRLFAVLDSKPTIVDAVDARDIKVTNGEIVFDNVSFSYGGSNGKSGKNIVALENIDIVVPAGKTVALVGASGAGKSTIMNLLMRFYDIAAGDGYIFIDGQDIRDVTQKSLRRNMALVSQEVLLFDDTVFANIAYGVDNASYEDVERAAKMAAAHEFIQGLPEGYDTVIGPSGAKLSGGQRQRISIARAMLKNAPILLLDEATSALDTESERAVQNALDDMMHNRTTLVIAHRLSTIQHADIIYVLDKGRVVESGSHSELLAKGAKGVYAKLYKTQFRKT